MASNRALESNNWRSKDSSSDSRPLRRNGSQNGNASNRLWGNGMERERRVRREEKARTEPARELADSKRIYVGNMPYMAQKSDVEKVFEEAGIAIENIDISIDPFTARNPSYCFVDLLDNDSAALAMEALNGILLLGRPMKIKPCIQKRTPPGGKESGIFNRWHQRNQDDRTRDRNQSASQDNDQASSANAYPTELFDSMKEGRRLYVGGLPKPLDQHTTDAEIRKLFSGYAVESVSKVKSPHPSAQSKPGNHFYAFVDFKTRQDAARAQKELDGSPGIGGNGTLRIHEARPTVPRKILEKRAWENGGGEDSEFDEEERNRFMGKKVFGKYNRETVEDGIDRGA